MSGASSASADAHEADDNKVLIDGLNALVKKQCKRWRAELTEDMCRRKIRLLLATFHPDKAPGTEFHNIYLEVAKCVGNELRR